MKTLGKLLSGCIAAILASSGAFAAVLYVNGNSGSPVSPYADWSTAARTIQDAVNAANPGDEVLVTNGIYNTGQSSMIGSNRVTILSPILVQSVNGPAVTVIQGYQVPGTTNGTSAIRCVYLANGATLSGFMLTNGATGSSSGNGGGIYCQSGNSSVFNCTIEGNTASGPGGGGFLGTYNNCLITGNAAYTSIGSGGGVYGASLTNCVVAANRAANGGGIYAPIKVVNCTVVNNTAGIDGGGAYGVSSPIAQFLNSIVYFNNAPFGSNVFILTSIVTSNSCSPNFANTTCITNLPGMVDPMHGDYHLQVGSSCIDAGNNTFAPPGTDLDGNPRIANGTVDMGAYENQFSGVVHFVSLAGQNPTGPYLSWQTAATNIQDAIDAASPGELVVVSNGVYKTGGRVIYGTTTNRIAVEQPITVASLNGPLVTVIAGTKFGIPIIARCVYLTNGATLTGFTLSNGVAGNSGDINQNQSGGGVWCESTNALVNDCILTANGALNGGGAFSGTLNNCTLYGNIATRYGGGTAFSAVENCLVSNNMASFSGGGVLGGLVLNSTVVTNQANLYGGGAGSNILINCTLINNWAVKGGGGTFYSVLTNCTLVENATTNGNGGGAIFGSLTGCTLFTNTANNGGGTCSNVLYNCYLNGNFANTGGGSYVGNATSCIFSNNDARNFGGATWFMNLTNCTLGYNYGGMGASVFGGICDNCQIWGDSIGIYSNTAYGCILMSNQYVGSAYSTVHNSFYILNGAVFGGSGSGGGSYSDTLDNCFLYANIGFGASGSILNNCAVTRNFEYGIGGAYATNCIIYSNTFSDFGGVEHIYLDHCCISSLPGVSGPGNFTNAPLFIDLYHLASNSPCIDTGNNAVVVPATDYDGRPRIVNGTVDIGAAEFQGANVEPFIAWLYKFKLPDDGSADYADSDGTGMNNWQKWIAGLNPTNPASVLRMSSLSNSVAGATVTWQSVTGITYYVQCSTNLSGVPAFSTIQSNIVGQAGKTSYTDPTADPNGIYFYRVGVQ